LATRNREPSAARALGTNGAVGWEPLIPLTPGGSARPARVREPSSPRAWTTLLPRSSGQQAVLSSACILAKALFSRSGASQAEGRPKVLHTSSPRPSSAGLANLAQPHIVSISSRTLRLELGIPGSAPYTEHESQALPTTSGIDALRLLRSWRRDVCRGVTHGSPIRRTSPGTRSGHRKP